MAAEINPDIPTKSGIMLGLGEETSEALQTFRDMRAVGVSILTIGQYLRPSKQHLPIVRWVTPEEFQSLKEQAYQMGFRYVASGPLVRSSYHAEEAAGSLLKG